MICPLCGKEHNGQYVIKVQEYYTKTDKINLVDAGVCKDCDEENCPYCGRKIELGGDEE